MKAIKNFKIVDIDVAYLEEEKEKYVKKKVLVKADALNQLIERLKSKKEFDSKVLEKEVNSLIDENRKIRKELVNQINNIEQKIYALSKFSKRETNNDLDISLMISNF